MLFLHGMKQTSQLAFSSKFTNPVVSVGKHVKLAAFILSFLIRLKLHEYARWNRWIRGVFVQILTSCVYMIL